MPPKYNLVVSTASPLTRLAVWNIEKLFHRYLALHPLCFFFISNLLPNKEEPSGMESQLRVYTHPLIVLKSPVNYLKMPVLPKEEGMNIIM